jgi:hypothetical protein
MKFEELYIFMIFFKKILTISNYPFFNDMY